MCSSVLGLQTQPQARDLKLYTEPERQRQINITFFEMQSVRRPSAAYRFR